MVSQAMAAVVITGTGKLQVTTTVAENIVGSLKVGEKVEALVRAVADEPFAGSIKSIVPAPPAGQTTYPVIIGFDEPSDALKPGMLVEVNMATGAAENVVTVPSDSVIIRGGQEVVAVLDSDNKIRIAEVETGLDDGERVEIKSGVQSGDNVLYEGQHYVDADSNVKVVE
jgi:RND family efflux transporter MFP subunit